MSLENIIAEITDIPEFNDSTNSPILYLGNDTTVSGNTWNFGNANVYLNVVPTNDNMITNKSYVDNLVSIQEKKIDTILDGASVSMENFKNFVDFVNQSQRENEAELYGSINDISFAIINEVTRANLSEEEIKTSIQNEVTRAIEVENGILNQIEDIRNKLENDKVSENVVELIETETTRAKEVETKMDISIKDIQAKLENETNRSIDAINTIDSTIDEIKTSVQFEVNRANEEETNIKQSIEDLKELFKNKSSPEGLDEIINSEKNRALDAEKELREKIEALYQYFFKSNTIPK
jgi:hypothetical protein